MIKVTVENIEKTLRKLAKYSAGKEKEFNTVVQKYSKMIAKKAKSNIKHNVTGNLKASIKTKYFKKQGPAATVFPRGKKGNHRHLVEYGTKMRTQKKTGRKVGKMPAKPFMKPAHEAYENQYFLEIKKLVEKNDTI